MFRIRVEGPAQKRDIEVLRHGVGGCMRRFRVSKILGAPRWGNSTFGASLLMEPPSTCQLSVGNKLWARGSINMTYFGLFGSLETFFTMP